MNASSPAMLINGVVAEHIPASDRGLAYGHGLFETIRVVCGKPVLWPQHMARLERGCARLLIDWPEQTEALLSEEVAQLCTGQDAILKIILTAGSGGLGYRLPKRQSVTRIVARYPLPDYPASYPIEGISVYTSEQRLSSNSLLAGVKHLNRLEQVMASAAMQNTDFTEAIMLDHTGRVIEGTRTNLFGVDSAGRLCSAKLDSCGVTGVMRQYLLELAQRLNIPTVEADYSQEAFMAMPELFVCNSVIGIWPIRRWQQQEYSAGPVTQRLQAEIAGLLAGNE